MPQAVAGVIVTGLGGAAAIGTVGVALVNIGVGIGFSLLSSALLQPANDNNAPGIETRVTTQGEATGQKIIVGRYATAGNEVCPPYSHSRNGKSGPGSFRTRVIDLSDVPQPGSRLNVVFVNGIRMNVALSDPHPDLGYTVTDEKHKDNIWFRYYDGTQTAADPYMVATYGDHEERPWTSDFIGRDTPHVIIHQRYDIELFPGESELLIESEGIPLYDISKDTTAGGSGPQRWADKSTWETTRNPQVINYNIARGITVKNGAVYGGRYTGDDLPATSWIPAIIAAQPQRSLTNAVYKPSSQSIQDVLDDLANGVVNEQTISANAEAIYADAATKVLQSDRFPVGYEINLAAVENGGTPPIEVMDAMNTASLAQMSDVGGVLYVQVGVPQLPDRFITDDDILVNKSQDMAPIAALESRYNAVKATYPSAELGYETRDAVEKRDLVAEARHGKYRPATLNLKAVTSEAAAQDAMDGYLKDAQRIVRHTASLPPEYHNVLPMRAFDYTSEFNGYQGKDFQISEVSIETSTLFTTVALREIDPTDTALSVDDEVLNPEPSVTQVYFTPELVPGFDVEGAFIADNAGAPRRPAQRMSWTEVEPDVTGIEWQTRLAVNQQVVAKGVIADLESLELFSGEGLVGDEGYQTRARLVADRETPWGSWFPFTTPFVGFSQSDFDAQVNEALDNVSNITGPLIELGNDNLDLLLQLANHQAESGQIRVATIASVTQEITERIDGDTALAGITTTLQAQSNDNAAAIFAEQTARADADSAQANDINALGASLGDLDARVVTVETASVDEDGAVAAVEQRLSAGTGVWEALADYTAFANATSGGSTSGFLLRTRAGGASGEIEIATAANPINGASSQVKISADRFQFLGSHAEFFSDVTINGSLLVNGSLGSVKIANGAITANKLAVDSVEAVNIKASNVTTEKINGKAVTNSEYSVVTSGTTAVSSVWTTCHSVSFNRDAGFETIIDLFMEVNFNTAGANDGLVQLLRNSSNLGAFRVRIEDTVMGFKWIDTNTSGGTVTYDFQIRSADSGDTWLARQSIADLRQRKR